MKNTSTQEYEEILKVIRNWPVSVRFVLLQDVLKTLSPASKRPTPRSKTAQKAAGLLATREPAPSDSEIDRWLDEHRMEKYG